MTLSDVRENIDAVDQQIKELVRRRMDLADQVAQVKARTGDDIYKPDREKAIIERLTGDVEPRIRREYTALIKRIMEVSRKYQYGRTLQLRDCLNLSWENEEPELKKAVMLKPELYICDMISKDIITCTDTYEQAADLLEAEEVQAGIGILDTVGICPSDSLFTLLAHRGLYIYRCKVVTDSGYKKKVVMFTTNLIVREDHNRLSVMFLCDNHSGSLASILTMISDYNVNLTEIHSHPFQGEEWNYEFYLELQGNLLDPEIQAMIFQLRSETADFRILGSYRCEGDF